MLDFPIGELLDEEASAAWLEHHLHPDGFRCPGCGSSERRVARRRGPFTGYRCLACDRYHTILSGTAFEKTRQRPSTLVLLLRGIAKGESTSRLARELELSRKQAHTLRHRVQRNLADTLPRGVIDDEVQFEADELYQNAGEKRRAAPGSGGSAATARKQGTWARDL
jgi:transposase-like protein